MRVRILLSSLLLLVPGALPATDFQLLDSIRLDDIEPLDTQGDLGMALAGEGGWLVAGSQRHTRTFGQAWAWRVTRNPAAVTLVGGLRPAEFDPFIATNATSRAGKFGSAIALSGEWMAISAPSAKENPDGSGNSYGAVFMLRASGADANPWQHAQRLVPTQLPDVAEYTSYGVPLAMADGILAVGVPLGDLFAGTDTLDAAGIVDLWRLSGGSWSFLQRLEAPSPQEGARFGYALSLRGGVLAVGEPQRDDDSETLDTGRVHVFRQSAGGSFVFEDTLLDPARQATDEFGSAVALVPGGLMVGTQTGGTGIGDPGDGSIVRFEALPGGWNLVGEQLGYDDHNVNPWGPGMLYDDGLLATSEPTLFEGRVSVWRSDGSALTLRDSEVDAPAGARGHYGLALALQRTGTLKVLTIGAPVTETESFVDAGRIDVLVYDEGLFSDGFED